VIIIFLSAIVLVLTSITIYLGVLIWSIHVLIREFRKQLQPPLVQRDGNGRPLRERK